MNFIEEKEKIEKAVYVIDKLSEGMDPYTGEIFEDSHITNNPKVVRCLKYVEEVLKETLKLPQKRTSNKELAIPFSITDDEISNIQYSEEPINITHICKIINEAAKTDEKGMKRLTAVSVNDALAEIGVLKITNFNNKRKTVVEDDYKNGYGIIEREAIFNGVKTITILYDKNGQKFIVDNLGKIAELIG